MGKAKAIVTITGVFISLFCYRTMSADTDNFIGSESDLTYSKSVQTTTKSTQTETKPVQTTTKATKPGSKSVQTTTKSTKTGTKPAQTTTKSTKTVTKPVQITTKSTKTVTKPAQAKTKTAQPKAKPIPVITKADTDKKDMDAGIVRIGSQAWAVANLDVSKFRNGDSIPEARTNNEWVAAGESGKPAWCYYNNDPANGPKYGKLYNWYAVNDPRGLAPAGWVISSDADWAKLAYSLGGPENAGKKMKNSRGWMDGNHGTNETGFTGLPGGYRVENGIFMNIGNTGIWWSSEESRTQSAIDHYLAMSSSLGRSSSPKQRGQSVRCLRE
jgi:uncharacterized protein (TIGR02145 family)